MNTTKFVKLKIANPNGIQHEAYSKIDSLITFEDEITVTNTATDTTFTVTFRMQISEYDDVLHSAEVSDNLFNLSEVTQKELQNQIDLINTTYSNGGPGPDPETSPHAACIESCKDKYRDEDGNLIHHTGLGGCKFGCWVDTAVRIVKALSPTLVKT